MISFPFESINTGTSQNPVYDRAITAEMERNLNKTCWTNGVFSSPISGLMVEATGGMKVRVNPGGCHLEGARAIENNYREINISTASATLARIDRIVCRFDTAENKRNIEIHLKEGVPATTPSPQEIIRQPNYYEIVLADVYVPSGVSEITNSYITDQRLNTALCGLVVPAIPHESQTETLWRQISDSIELVNSALDGTIAGNLQNQITTNKNDIVSTNAAIGTAVNGLETTMKGINYPISDASVSNLFNANTLKAILEKLGVVYVVSKQTVNGWERTRYSDHTQICKRRETRYTQFVSIWGSTNLTTSGFNDFSLAGLGFTSIAHYQVFASGSNSKQAFVGESTCTNTLLRAKATAGYAPNNFSINVSYDVSVEGRW